VEGQIKQSLYLAALLSAPSMLLLWMAPHLLTLFKQDPVVVANTQLLLHAMVWGLPGFLFFFVMREVASAFSLGRMMMLVNLLCLPLTFGLNYLLMYGKYGLPALGIAGIGYAGAIVMWVLFFSTLIYARRHPVLKAVLPLSLPRPDFAKMKVLFCLGAPAGGLTVLDNSLFFMSAIMIGYFGVVPLAAYQIAIQCGSIAYNIPLAVSIVTSLQVSYAVGSGNQHKAKSAAYLGLKMGLGVSILIALIFLFAPGLLVRAFISPDMADYAAIRALTISFLIMTALFVTADALQTIANGILRGFKDTLIPMLLSVPCYWVLGIGGAYYFAFHTHLAAEGIWFGLTLGISSLAVILLLRLWGRLK
jgi:MATE family multidrug resistance protein